jgi:hypothetical protein
MLRRPKVPGGMKKIFLPIDQYVDFDGVIFLRGAASNCGQIGRPGWPALPKSIQLYHRRQAITRSRSRLAAMAEAARTTPKAVSQRSGVIIKMAPVASRIRVHQASAHFA